MTLSLHEQCLDAAKAKIEALTLSAPWTATEVHKRKFPWNRDTLADGSQAVIFVTPVNDRIRPATNVGDDFDYGVQITAALKTNMKLVEGMADTLLIREQLMRAFLPVHGALPLAGLSAVYNVLVEPGPVIDPSSFERMYDVSAFVIRCICRRNRGGA